MPNPQNQLEEANNGDQQSTASSIKASCTYYTLITVAPFFVAAMATLKILFDMQSDGTTSLTSNQILAVSGSVGVATSAAANVIDCLCSSSGFFRSASAENTEAEAGEAEPLIEQNATP